jgi:hypothetical protein
MSADEDILAKWLAGELAGEDALAWERRLDEEPGLRARAMRHAEVAGLLGVALEDEVAVARRHARWMAEIRKRDQEEFVGAVMGRVKRWHHGRFTAAAAVLIAALGLWIGSNSKKQAVGSVVRVETVEWENDAGHAAGQPLYAGTRLHFHAGLVELDLAGRGRMIVEGPADLEIRGALEATLRDGRVMMRVEESGHGYRLETPGGAVVDLGTEFGVSVRDGGVETHVLDGKVEAFPTGGEKMLLGKDDAVRFAGSGVERIEADAGSFYTRLPPPREESLRAIHWPLDDGTDGEPERAVVRGFGPGEWDMRPAMLGVGRLPEGIPGVFGNARHFDGEGAFMESAFPGIGGDDPRTVCFWVKVPEDFRVSEGFGIVSWGSFTSLDPGSVWQISVNPLAKDGPVGRIRVGVHGGQIVGQTDLRNGRWHHVAVVLYPATRADIGKHVMVYLDGELEPLSRRSLVELNTRTDEANHGVWIARNVAYDPDAPNLEHGGYFRGGVDELFIFDAALSQDEICRLMRENRQPDEP